jgi:hypothetical protein
VRLLAVVAETGSRWESTASVDLDLSLDLSGSLGGGPSSSVLIPDPHGPTEDVEETRDTDEEGDLDFTTFGDGTLHGREDGSTGNTHDKETGSSSSVSTKTGCTEDEDDWVHDGFETHDGNQADDTTDTRKRSDEDNHEESTKGAGGEEDGSRDDGKKSDTDESANGEGDETVRQELRSLRVLEEGDIVGVVEEESSDGNLSTDVEELSDETGNGSSLLPEGLVEVGVTTLSVGKSLGLGL